MLVSFLFAVDFSSKYDNDNPTPAANPRAIKTSDIPLKSCYVIPSPAAIIDSGSAAIELLSDNSFVTLLVL